MYSSSCSSRRKIVIGNNEVRLEKKSSLKVKNIDDFVPYLDSLSSSEHFPEEERMQIKRFLEQQDIGANSFAVVSFREQINYVKEIVREVSMAASFNQSGKVLYYKMQDIVSYVLIGLIAVVLIGGAMLLQDFDSFILLLVGVCLVIITIAGAVHIGKKIKIVFEKIMAGYKW